MALAANARIQFCQAGDEEELAAFERRMFEVPSSARFWRWKYFDNPAGEACVAVARINDEIVGRVGVMPMRMCLLDRETVGSQQVDVAIMPTHRRGGVYFQLVQAVIQQSERRGLSLGYGFASEQTSALSTEFLGFCLVGRVRRLVKVLDYGFYLRSLFGRRRGGRLRREAVRSNIPPDCTPVSRFDERVDHLAAALTPERIMVVRDAVYLNWRYIDCPTVRYHCYSAQVGDSHGFIVFHAYESQKVVRGVIDELLCPPHDGVLERLVGTALAALIAEGAVNAICWLPTWHPLGARLRRLGFWDREAHTDLVAFPTDGRMPASEPFCRESNWYYTHGDSDYHMRSGP